MRTRKSWLEFFLYLARVGILLILLAMLLPKLVTVCSIWMSSHLNNERKPTGNPMRVEDTTKPWSKFVIQLFPDEQRK
ncbi:MAG: hypothetical protein M0T74_00300 [Desulfitobacterium hafniense]|nr:hypothetical protein [Desulfitobacterium hafniense]